MSKYPSATSDPDDYRTVEAAGSENSEVCCCERGAEMLVGWVVVNALCTVHGNRAPEPDDHESSPEHWMGQCDCDD